MCAVNVGNLLSKGSSHSTSESSHWQKGPYECSDSGKSFICQYGLRTHQRVHTGKRPYECSECGKFL